MAIKLSSTRDAAQDQGIKVLVYGISGAGKTRLCATTDQPALIISAESGLLSLRDHDIAVIDVASIEDVREAYDYVTSKEGQKFAWVCLDSISEIAEVVLAAEKRATKDPRQAYGALADTMMGLLRAFRDLPGRNVYMSCKADRIKDEDSGAVLNGPSLPGQRLAAQLPYMFDEVFCLRVERDAEGAPTRWLQTQGDRTHIAKDRSGSLDLFEAPDLSTIAAKIRATHPAAKAA
jgi:phage nucleotide-binding protein